MSTSEREVGFPWFDNHAIRCACEIFSYSRNMVGESIRPRFMGCVWETQADIRAFYEEGPQQSACDAPGFVDYRDFDSWEEAEAWLRGAVAA